MGCRIRFGVTLANQPNHHIGAVTRILKKLCFFNYKISRQWLDSFLGGKPMVYRYPYELGSVLIARLKIYVSVEKSIFGMVECKQHAVVAIAILSIFNLCTYHCVIYCLNCFHEKVFQEDIWTCYACSRFPEMLWDDARTWRIMWFNTSHQLNVVLMMYGQSIEC